MQPCVQIKKLIADAISEHALIYDNQFAGAVLINDDLINSHAKDLLEMSLIAIEHLVDSAEDAVYKTSGPQNSQKLNLGLACWEKGFHFIGVNTNTGVNKNTFNKV